MPIHEESFRIGCGRYIQGAGYLDRCGEEISRLGKSVLVVGGKTALSVARERIEKSLKKAFLKYEFIIYGGTCNDKRAEEIAIHAKERGYEVIAGVGGGVIMDFAKLCAYYSDLPVVNVPTSSATCAAYTPLSVRYTEDGRTVGTLHYKNEVSSVVVDTEIISKEPTRLFLAGVFDSLAKFVEIKQRFTEENENYPMGLDYAYAMAKRSFDLLEKKTKKYIKDVEACEINDDVEKVIFATVAVPGIISGVARGSNQTALAHKFYEATRFLYPHNASPYLHGEIVGVGLLLQNLFNGEEKNNGYLISLMKSHNMPHRITDVGVPRTDESFEKYYSYIAGSSAIDKSNVAECERFRKCLEHFWNIE